MNIRIKVTQPIWLVASPPGSDGNHALLPGEYIVEARDDGDGLEFYWFDRRLLGARIDENFEAVELRTPVLRAA